jgi:hypothetical protein
VYNANELEYLYYKLGKIDQQMVMTINDINNTDSSVLVTLREKKENLIKEINKSKTLLFKTLKYE